MEFVTLRNSIVIVVLPKAEGRKDSVAAIDYAVFVATLGNSVIDGKRIETISSLSRNPRLWRKVPNLLDVSALKKFARQGLAESEYGFVAALPRVFGRVSS